MKNIDNYKYKIEMHTHTSPCSACSNIKPKDLIKIYKSHGYDGVCLTNHFDHTYLKLSPKKAREKYLEDFYVTNEYANKMDIRLYMGMELRFTENYNDYLIYGFNPDFLEIAHNYLDKGIEKFSNDFLNKSDLIIFQAHPFRQGLTRVSPDIVNGIESYNMHPTHNSKIALAHKYAAKHNLIEIAGTDYHDYGSHCLSGLMMNQLPKDSKELALILKKNDFLITLFDKILI